MISTIFRSLTRSTISAVWVTQDSNLLNKTTLHRILNKTTLLRILSQGTVPNSHRTSHLSQTMLNQTILSLPLPPSRPTPTHHRLVEHVKRHKMSPQIIDVSLAFLKHFSLFPTLCYTTCHLFTSPCFHGIRSRRFRDRIIRKSGVICYGNPEFCSQSSCLYFQILLVTLLSSDNTKY